MNTNNRIRAVKTSVFHNGERYTLWKDDFGNKYVKINGKFITANEKREI